MKIKYTYKLNVSGVNVTKDGNFKSIDSFKLWFLLKYGKFCKLISLTQISE